MENEAAVQLQVKEFITDGRPDLVAAAPKRSEYELSSARLSQSSEPEPEPIVAKPTAPDVADDPADSPAQAKLADGRYRIRTQLLTLSQPPHESWYEIRVGGRHRFTYRRVKDAVRAFNKLSPKNLLPSGWVSSNGGGAGPAAIPTGPQRASWLHELIS